MVNPTKVRFEYQDGSWVVEFVPKEGGWEATVTNRTFGEVLVANGDVCSTLSAQVLLNEALLRTCVDSP